MSLRRKMEAVNFCIIVESVPFFSRRLRDSPRREKEGQSADVCGRDNRQNVADDHQIPKFFSSVHFSRNEIPFESADSVELNHF